MVCRCCMCVLCVRVVCLFVCVVRRMCLYWARRTIYIYILAVSVCCGVYVPCYCAVKRMLPPWCLFFDADFCCMYGMYGMSQAKLQEEPSDTPLQEKLDAMAAMIGYVGMACAAATFVATMCVYFTTHRVSI